jgi:hypothetical protein
MPVTSLPKHAFVHCTTFFLLQILACGLVGCSEPKSQQPSVSGRDTTGISTSGAILLEGETVVIPPPSLLSHIIAKESIPFENHCLSDPDHPERWTSEHAKALNLGVMGADLSYLINHGQGTSIPQYLAAIRRLTDNLGISQEVNPELLNQIEAGLDNPSKVLGLHGVFFRNMETYLQNNNQSDISTCILLGGWTESMYQILLSDQDHKNASLHRLLVDQVFCANGIQTLSELIKNPALKDYQTSISKLCKLLDAFQRTYESKEPLHDKNSGITYLRGQTKVQYTDAQWQELTETITQTRNLIVAV